MSMIGKQPVMWFCHQRVEGAGDARSELTRINVYECKHVNSCLHVG